MAQEAETTPQAGQESPAPESKEGQEPQAEPKGDAKTFGEEYVTKLRAEAAKYRTEAQEAKARAQEYEDRDKSELEKLTGKLTKAEQRAEEAHTKLLRYEVAAEKGLDPKVAAVLSGSSREELEAAAEVILEQVKAKQPTPDFDGGTREPAPEAKPPEQAHNDSLLAVLGLTPNN